MRDALISYKYKAADGSGVKEGEWRGPRGWAVLAAAEALHAEQIGHHEWLFCEPTPGSKWPQSEVIWRASSDALVSLGAALRAGIPLDLAFGVWALGAGLERQQP